MTDQPNSPWRGITTPVVEQERTVQRAVAAAAIGNIAEWFDFGIYSYLAAVVLEQVFQVGQRGERVRDDAVRTSAADVGHHGDTAGIPLGGRVVQPLGRGDGGEDHCADLPRLVLRSRRNSATSLGTGRHWPADEFRRLEEEFPGANARSP